MFHGGGGPGGGGGGGRLHGAMDADDEEILGKVYDSTVLSRMPRFMIGVKAWIVLGLAGSLLRIGAQAATPLVVGLTIDNFISTGDRGGLNLIILLLIGVALAMWAGQYLQTLFLAFAGQAVLLQMRGELFNHLHKLSMSFFDHNKVGKLMSRVQNDVNQLQEVLTMGIANILTSILLLLAIIVIMLFMNPRLALITLSVVPVLGLVLVIWQQFARKAFINVRRAIAEVNDQLQENISGVRVVQSLSREDVNVDHFDGVNRAHLDANITAARLQAVMMPAVQVMTGVAYGLLIIFGGQQVLSGAMGVGVLMAFLLYVQRFFDPVIELTMMYTQLQRAMASGSRIFEVLDLKPSIEDAPEAVELPPIKGEIKFNNVSFSYVPGIEVLHDIDLTVNPGETVAIVGRTGAGKSSLINLGARFYEATSGEISVDGHAVSSITQASLRRQIGLVPQDAFLFAGSIEENIRYGRLDATRDEIVDAAKAAGVHELVTHLEHGYDTAVGERGSNLSAGQRQLVCLARAILSDPPIMILDEATSNVDTNTERIMQASLRRLSEGRTCIIIAHRLSTVTSADRIVALESGRIVESGNHQELLDKKGLYFQMFETLSALEPD
ncbi:MAG: ABC transporter ATP-binding protein [Dehalococcoidales bacterium]|nr:ABC transporter ATP-binding protein [Dehalococcoidales bacterium]MDP6501366.1 ABC transporter ATP-binding protein [Dehalococcoidales bacterium]MDP6633113.1 ABC transporter ATP-binding protein [Dehalococcoidales bacterium]